MRYNDNWSQIYATSDVVMIFLPFKSNHFDQTVWEQSNPREDLTWVPGKY